MVVLQRGLQVVCDGQVMPGLDQEVVVDPGVLKVMNQGCNVRGQQREAVSACTLQDASVHHQHVGHLENGSHMGTAAGQV